MAGIDTGSLARAWELIAWFFGEGTTPPAGVEPELLDRVVTLHRLYGALADPRLAVRSPEVFVTPEIWRRWRRLHDGTLVQALQRPAPLRRILAALAPMEAIVFKGAAVAELLYPSPGARPMVDVDLLVRAEDVPEAMRRLQSLGYRCYFWLRAITRLRDSRSPRLRAWADRPYYWDRPVPRRAYDFEWSFIGSDLKIDLHSGFTQQARMAADYAGVFARALPWPALAPNARLLAPEDAVVAHAIQPARNGLSLSGCPAITLLDLKLMLEREGPFWGPAGGPPLGLEQAARRATEWGAGALVHAGLAYTARLFPKTVARAEVAEPQLPEGHRRAIDRLLLDRAFPPRLEDPARGEVWMRDLLLTPPEALLRLSAQRVTGALAKVALATVSLRRSAPGE